jgi:hypothetical protein
VRFQVTSITAEEVAPYVRDVTVKLREWLNASMSDGDFGGHLDQVTMVIVSVEDEPEQNERWAKSHRGLGRPKNPFTGETYTELSFAVAIPPSKFDGADLEKALRVASSAAIQTVLDRPKRVPKGFDYERFAKGLSAALNVYVTV